MERRHDCVLTAGPSADGGMSSPPEMQGDPGCLPVPGGHPYHSVAQDCCPLLEDSKRGIGVCARVEAHGGTSWVSEIPKFQKARDRPGFPASGSSVEAAGTFHKGFPCGKWPT